MMKICDLSLQQPKVSRFAEQNFGIHYNIDFCKMMLVTVWFLDVYVCIHLHLFLVYFFFGSVWISITLKMRNCNSLHVLLYKMNQ